MRYIPLTPQLHILTDIFALINAFNGTAKLFNFNLGLYLYSNHALEYYQSIYRILLLKILVISQAGKQCSLGQLWPWEHIDEKSPSPACAPAEKGQQNSRKLCEPPAM